MLELDRVDTYRGPAHVLRGVSLTVAAGEAVCLVGRNGAGKTTTMESVIGLLRVRSGRVAFQGRDITNAAPHERARLGIGYAPEGARVFPDLTVAENLLLSRWLSDPNRKRRDGLSQADDQEQLLAMFPELPPLMRRKGLNLSGGQKKMVAIARAMALGPSLLLLDEPFEGLAPIVVNRFIDTVQHIRAMGVGLLIAESNVGNATRVADRLYAIDRGEIIFQGDPASAASSPELMRTLRG